MDWGRTDCAYDHEACAGVAATGSAKDAVKFFISKGWTKEQAAGIVGNLQAESGKDLKTNAVGDGGRAIGAFQLHKSGLGCNLSIDDRKNIYTNTNVIGIQILKNDRLFSLNENGEEIPELSAVFAEEIMKPANIEQRKDERRKIANKIFPKRL